MKLYKNIIPKKFIDQINSEINNIYYSESLWLFDNGNSSIHKLVRDQLSKLELFKDIIGEAHIVIRCVKFEDKKNCHYPHFDNYLDTYVVPIHIPNNSPYGDLVYIENLRSLPKSIYINIITKFFYQNSLSQKILLKYFKNRFSSSSINPGDVFTFNGLTTLHYNNPVSSERRSILIHFNNPFKHTYLNRIIEYVGKLRVKRI